MASHQESEYSEDPMEEQMREQVSDAVTPLAWVVGHPIPEEHGWRSHSGDIQRKLTRVQLSVSLKAMGIQGFQGEIW